MMDEILTRILDVFTSHYDPAGSYMESDEQITSDELIEKMESFYPETVVMSTDLINAMEKKGFKFDYVEDEFKWLLKRK